MNRPVNASRNLAVLDRIDPHANSASAIGSRCPAINAAIIVRPDTPKRITVNAVCPGYVDTPMTDASIANVVARTGRDSTSVREYFAGQQPTGRLVSVEEVAAAVAFCVANPSVTGQGTVVDGGATQS